MAPPSRGRGSLATHTYIGRSTWRKSTRAGVEGVGRWSREPLGGAGDQEGPRGEAPRGSQRGCASALRAGLQRTGRSASRSAAGALPALPQHAGGRARPPGRRVDKQAVALSPGGGDRPRSLRKDLTELERLPPALSLSYLPLLQPRCWVKALGQVGCCQGRRRFAASPGPSILEKYSQRAPLPPRTRPARLGAAPRPCWPDPCLPVLQVRRGVSLLGQTAPS